MKEKFGIKIKEEARICPKFMGGIRAAYNKDLL